MEKRDTGNENWRNVRNQLSKTGIEIGNDTVNHPEHYNTGGIETLDYIKAKVSDYPSYAIGNIIKYISRFEHKNGLEDLKKGSVLFERSD